MGGNDGGGLGGGGEGGGGVGGGDGGGLDGAARDYKTNPAHVCARHTRTIVRVVPASKAVSLSTYGVSALPFVVTKRAPRC